MRTAGGWGTPQSCPGWIIDSCAKPQFPGFSGRFPENRENLQGKFVVSMLNLQIPPKISGFRVLLRKRTG